MTVRFGVEASRRLRWGAFGLIAILATASIVAEPANARHRHHRHHAVTHAHARARVHTHAAAYDPPFASLVVDANTGAVLEQTNPDSLRHPASLTKVMTLYLLFEQLEAGRMSLNTALPVSAHAAAQSPTKLGLRPGSTIPVEAAIKAIVTRSANDVAVVIAEAIGGTEQNFARMMTQKAHALGMSRTVYDNASGLPDDAQVTTARDQVLLGRAIQERFPQYYHYFDTTQFVFRGHEIRGHNHLLTEVDGVDGIKTGYTRDSGFNLLTSMWHGRRHVVAAIFGGHSAASRDAQMRRLLAATIMNGSTVRTGSLFGKPTAARNERQFASTEAPAPRAKPLVLHAAAEPDFSTTGSAPETFHVVHDGRSGSMRPGSTAPIKPTLVKTIAIKPPGRTETHKFTATEHPQSHPIKTAEATPAAHADYVAVRASEHAQPEKQVHSGWMIQVGAFDAERDARQRLSSVRSHAKRLLRGADPFTETVTKGDKTLYRARFAGLDREQAEAACRALKRNDIACMTLRN